MRVCVWRLGDGTETLTITDESDGGSVGDGSPEPAAQLVSEQFIRLRGLSWLESLEVADRATTVDADGIARLSIARQLYETLRMATDLDDAQLRSLPKPLGDYLIARVTELTHPNARIGSGHASKRSD